MPEAAFLFGLTAGLAFGVVCGFVAGLIVEDHVDVLKFTDRQRESK